MLVRIHHAEDGESAPDRLIFGFFPVSLRRRMGLAGRRFPEAADPGSAGPDPPVLRIEPGERRFAGLGRDRGDRFAFWLPGGKTVDLSIVVGSLNSLVRESSVSLQVRTKDEGLFPISDLRLGRIRLLHVPPEALAFRNFREILDAALGEARVGALIVDEAHAVSEWSPAFRPAYRRIPRLVEDLSRRRDALSVLALSAAGDPETLRDAADRLGLADLGIPLRTDLYRPSASLQIATATGPEEKAAVRERILTRDAPELFAREGLSAPDFGPGIESGSEPEIGYDPGAGKPENPGRAPASPRASLAVRPSEDGTGESPDSPGIRPEPPDRIVVTTRNDRSPDRAARVELIVDRRSGLGGGIRSWLRWILGDDPAGPRVHRVRIVDPPADPCEADLLERGERVPRCRDGRCAFGRPVLCDYGREHHRILREGPDPTAETLIALEILDSLLAGSEAESRSTPGPIRVPAGEAGPAAAELALHRLRDMGLFSDVFREPERDREGFGKGFLVYGFAPPTDPEAVWAGLSRHLREHDRSSSGRLARIAPEELAAEAVRRASEPETVALRDRIRQGVRAGRFAHYDSHRVLFDALAAALPRRVSHVADFRRERAYRRLWNLGTWLSRRDCRYAGLLRTVAAIDEGWRCEACDRCAPDLRFDAARRSPPGGVPGLPDLESACLAWMADPESPWEATEADRRIERFGDAFENIAARSARLLEDAPRNLKALYMAREFAREAERPMAERDLIRIARRDLPPLQIVRLCETAPAPEPVRRIRFDLLDDEDGALATPEGERWLHVEASSLAAAPERLALLGGRLVLDALARVDLVPHLDRLDRLRKEIFP
jgi:hypothetical protein